MKILWIINIIVPKLAEYLGFKHTNFGGWISSLLNEVAQDESIEIGVVSTGPVSKIVKIEIDNVTYYCSPTSAKDKYDIDKKDCLYILNDFEPDLLHIEGSEFAHANTFMQNFEGPNVLSLQGILKGCANHQYGGLPIDEIIFSLSLRKLIIGWSLYFRKRFFFNPRLKKESETLQLAKNFLGRTNWDRAYSYSINPKATYYTCSRVLRPVFYEKEWNVTKKETFSIFVGNGYSALKGVHYVLEAIAQLRDEFPDIHLYIAGESPYLKSNREFKKRVGYSLYLRYFIIKLRVKNNITFLGELNSEQMSDRLAKSHIYILPSTIENSPNTLGEAMILGVPSISSYVGGAPDMAKADEEVLFYRDCESPSLAWRIKQIFDDEDLALKLSKNGQKRALVNHNKEDNVNKLLYTYNQILRKND